MNVNCHCSTCSVGQRAILPCHVEMFFKETTLGSRYNLNQCRCVRQVSVDFGLELIRTSKFIGFDLCLFPKFSNPVILISSKF